MSDHNTPEKVRRRNKLRAGVALLLALLVLDWFFVGLTIPSDALLIELGDFLAKHVGTGGAQ